MTLIEVIGVLAIISIFAAVALPALLKQIDKKVADQEVVRLQSFSDALQRRIMRYGYIPGASDWATNVAVELGLAPTDVTSNARYLTNYLIFDPAFTTSPGSLPYLQTSAGAASAPTGARAFLVSSLGKALPNLGNGVSLSASDFNVIWNTADRTVPSATVFSGWTGSGDDLKLQRINLASLFARLVLSEYASSASNVSYSIGTNSLATVTQNTPLNAYFLKGTVVNLYSNNPVGLSVQFVLNDDSSYWFYQDAWRGYLPGTTGVPGAPAASTNLAGAFDFAALVNGFLTANPTSRGASQQTLIVQDFINYMNAYNTWAASGFTSSSAYNQAVALQATMVTDINNLIGAIVPQ